MPAPSLVMQTVYAELLERCAANAFNSSFPEDGSFISKTVRDRRYWYFQLPSEAGRTQRYVGAETPELLKQIAGHKQARDDEKERRSLISTLTRSFGLPRPLPEIGAIVEALARAGVFRLAGVLVGTVAYQTYSGMLGVKLPIAAIQTGDVDIAQFTHISVAVEDRIPPVLEVLSEVDPTFRAVPALNRKEGETSYVAKSGIRVDFLTPNDGPETDEPQPLPALQTDAQPLRFLSFLIREPQQAIVMHGAGIQVLVPSPERFAVHKLIISRRRAGGAAKQDKDLRQAEALLSVLIEKRPYELKQAWDEAYASGRTWRKLLQEGLAIINPDIRDTVLRLVKLPRSAIAGLDLRFDDARPKYDANRDVVLISGKALGHPVQVVVSGEALEDYFGSTEASAADRVKSLLNNRSKIEKLAIRKYSETPVEEVGSMLLTTFDIEHLKADAGIR
jgi:hypothetical protein